KCLGECKIDLYERNINQQCVNKTLSPKHKKFRYHYAYSIRTFLSDKKLNECETMSITGEQGSIGYALTCYIHSHAQIVQSLIDYFKSISNQTSMIETKLTPNNKIQFDFGYDKHLNSSHLVQVYRSTVGQLLIEIKFLCYPLKIVAKLICLPCPPGTYMIKKRTLI
ncbi:unnamed protein product, partial [Didymodactylos carnosus]